MRGRATLLRTDGQLALRATWLGMQATSPFSTRLAGRFADRLWFTPWHDAVSAQTESRQAAWLADTQPLVLHVGDHTLAGYSAGEGPTVLLVHGWGDRAATMGGFVAPLVAAGHRVVAIDLPGHGESREGPANLYSFAAALRSVGDQLDGLKGVIGHSMGALATAIALRDGLTADAVALIAPAVRLEHGLQRFTTLFRLSPKAVTGLKASIDRRFGSAVWQELAGDSAAADLDVPALIIHDESDTQVAVEDAVVLATAWPAARLLTTSGLGHTRILRDPTVIEEIVSFLRSPAAGRASERTAPSHAESLSGGTA